MGDSYIRHLVSKLMNFADRSPVRLGFFIPPSGQNLVVQNLSHSLPIEQSFDLTGELSVSDFIHEVRNWLVVNWYPTLTQDEIVEVNYSPEELESLISEHGIPLDQALALRKSFKRTTLWRIEKVVLKRDEIFVRNLQTGQFFRYRMKLPVVLFLKRLREQYSAEEAWTVFRSQSILITELKSSNEESQE